MKHEHKFIPRYRKGKPPRHYCRCGKRYYSRREVTWAAQQLDAVGCKTSTWFGFKFTEAL